MSSIFQKLHGEQSISREEGTVLKKELKRVFDGVEAYVQEKTGESIEMKKIFGDFANYPMIRKLYLCEWNEFTGKEVGELLTEIQIRLMAATNYINEWFENKGRLIVVLEDILLPEDAKYLDF